jgi:hypothetical protein
MQKGIGWPHMFFVTEAQAILLNLGTWAFMKPGDFADILISKVLHFLQSVGLLNVSQRVAQKIRNSQGACHKLLYFSLL